MIKLCRIKQLQLLRVKENPHPTNTFSIVHAKFKIKLKLIMDKKKLSKIWQECKLNLNSEEYEMKEKEAWRCQKAGLYHIMKNYQSDTSQDLAILNQISQWRLSNAKEKNIGEFIEKKDILTARLDSLI